MYMNLKSSRPKASDLQASPRPQKALSLGSLSPGRTKPSSLKPRKPGSPKLNLRKTVSPKSLKPQTQTQNAKPKPKPKPS